MKRIDLISILEHELVLCCYVSKKVLKIQEGRVFATS
jgi:hypothetical protein